MRRSSETWIAEDGGASAWSEYRPHAGFPVAPPATRLLAASGAAEAVVGAASGASDVGAASGAAEAVVGAAAVVGFAAAAAGVASSGALAGVAVAGTAAPRGRMTARGP